MNSPAWLTISQATAVDEAAIPAVAADDLCSHLVDARNRGARLAQLFGRRMRDGALQIYAIVSFDADSLLQVCCAQLRPGQTGYPSITAQWPAAQAFEREIAEQFGITPAGHPWLKPLRRIDDHPFFRVEGDEVHEVAVGPVHAGIIEPGHFRFQCHGEDILHLEIALGYQHRGVEALLLHLNATRSAIVAETIAGDTTVGHVWSYCTALEGLSESGVSVRAAAIRGIALELERLANHTGDLGALAGDVAFLPSSAFLGRLRGEFLNLTCEICGNRFGRNLLRPGGVSFDIDTSLAGRLRSKLIPLKDETLSVIDLMLSQASVLARFEGTGILRTKLADDLGVVGVAARSSGLARDVRRDHPHGVFQFAHVPVAVQSTGDVYARAVVRRLEVERSIEFLIDMLGNLPAGEPMRSVGALKPNAMSIGLCEAWRGETMHVAFTDDAGKLDFVKIKDPSIHNWFAMAQALRGVAISDFPLCNKSFNLSYAGHDL